MSHRGPFLVPQDTAATCTLDRRRRWALVVTSTSAMLAGLAVGDALGVQPSFHCAWARGDRDGEITRLQRRAYDRLKDNLEELTLEDRRILNDPDFPWGAGALPSAEDISKHTGIPLARIVDIRRGYR